MNAEEILSQYQGLWQVEESSNRKNRFESTSCLSLDNQTNKGTHIAICFIAFSLIRFLHHRIREKTGQNYSAERIRQELLRIQESILVDTTDNNKYVIPSKPSPYAVKIYEAMSR